MIEKNIIDNDFSRSISRIFTNPIFREVIATGDSKYFWSKVGKYKHLLIKHPQAQIKHIVSEAYCYLGRNYRNEYIYKNTILNNILLGRHSLRTATMLDEFKVAGSIADVVILNGTSTVYEIKTELDSPEKLKKQLQDYRKAFSKVFLVVHNSIADKYLQLISNSSVGLLSLSDRFNLSLVKEATEDYSELCNTTMMKMLRKGEYTNIIRRYKGSIPNVSNIRFFSECLRIAVEIDSKTLHDLILTELRARKPLAIESLESDALPRELKHICLCVNPSKAEYQNLHNFLNLSI